VNGIHIQPKIKGHEANLMLKQAGDVGHLDKLAIADAILGSSDRHRGNYLTSPKPPHIHLIDNGLNMNHEDTYFSAYLTDYHHINGTDLEHAILHPEAQKWLVSLDPFALNKELAAQGIPPELASQSVAKLLSMQTAVIMGQNKINDILFSHERYKRSI
jgi:hypothetical protein